jgi:hypothetical protein
MRIDAAAERLEHRQANALDGLPCFPEPGGHLEGWLRLGPESLENPIRRLKLAC